MLNSTGTGNIDKSINFKILKVVEFYSICKQIIKLRESSDSALINPISLSTAVLITQNTNHKQIVW